MKSMEMAPTTRMTTRRKQPLARIENNVENEGAKRKRFSFYVANKEEQGLQRSKKREADLMEELSSMHSKYEKLKELKFKDVENIYSKYKNSVKERSNASDELLGWYKDEADRLRTLTQRSKEVNACKDVERYRRENAALKSELLDMKAKMVEYEMTALEQGTARDENKAPDQPPNHDRKDSTAVIPSVLPAPSAGVLRFFAVLTGGAVKELQHNKFDVMIVNPENDRRMRFQITLEETDMEYVPIEIAMDGTNDQPAPEIPPYLTETIYFELSEAPIFFSKIAATVFWRP